MTLLFSIYMDGQDIQDGGAGLLASQQAEETVFHAIFCHFVPFQLGEGTGVVAGVGPIPGGMGAGWRLRVLLFLAVIGHQGTSVSVWISSCGKTMGICVTSLYGDSTNVRNKGGR